VEQDEAVVTSHSTVLYPVAAVRTYIPTYSCVLGFDAVESSTFLQVSSGGLPIKVYLIIRRHGPKQSNFQSLSK
jgi:hypothetical protein